MWADLETHDTAHNFSQGVCGQILRHMTLLIALVKVYVGDLETHDTAHSFS